MTRRKKYNESGATTLSIKPPPMQRSVIESDVAVPVLWAVLLAGSIGLVATLTALALREVLDVQWDWWVPLAVGGCTAAVVFCWRCTIAEGDRRQLLLWPIEAALGQDLDQDGWVGEPEPMVEPVGQDPRLIYVHNAGQERHLVQAKDFRYFLVQAWGERGTAWRDWESARLPSGKMVGQRQWEDWCARLIQAGLGFREYPTAQLTLAGDFRGALQTFREIL